VGSDPGASGKSSARRIPKNDGISLADFCAEVAIRCGLTLSEVIDHTIPQLKLLAQAAERIRATQGLVDLNIAVAAGAAVQCKNGKKILNDVQRNLKKAANGK
jgi:hypothetical protein